MKGKLASVLFVAGTALAWAQVPPNDDFTNRTVLVGSSFIITADTAGATWDIWSEPSYYPLNVSFYENGYPAIDDLWGAPSLWWSWTPTESSTVVIENADPFELIRACLKVYHTTTLSYSSQNDQVCGIHLRYHGQYAVFQAQAGIEYQISVCSRVARPLHFRWTATNTPLFRLHPKTQTISPGQSVLFTASAVGEKTIHYQWRKDGADILDATNQMLVFDNCTPANAAAYSVVATCAGGSSASSVANLFVATNAAPPALVPQRVAANDSFRFAVSGEEGRKYQIEYSDDLRTWQAPGDGVIINSNATTEFTVRKDAPVKFLRLKHYRPASEGCNNGFRQLKFAIWQCAEEWHLDDSSTLWPEGLTPYFVNKVFPYCPDTGGEYVWVNVVAKPTCELGWSLGHAFEEP